MRLYLVSANGQTRSYRKFIFSMKSGWRRPILFSHLQLLWNLGVYAYLRKCRRTELFPISR